MTPNLPTEILEAAKKATAHTKGPLSVHYSGRDFCLTTPSGPFKGITVTHMIDGEANAEYLALACNNAVALAEEVLALRADNERLKDICDERAFDVLAKSEEVQALRPFAEHILDDCGHCCDCMRESDPSSVQKLIDWKFKHEPQD